MLTRSPSPLRSWSRNTSVAVIAPSRLTSTILRASSRCPLPNGPRSITPALLIRTSAQPKSCSIRFARSHRGDHRLRENTAAVDLELTPEDLEEMTAVVDLSTFRASAIPRTCNGGSTADPLSAHAPGGVSRVSRRRSAATPWSRCQHAAYPRFARLHGCLGHRRRRHDRLEPVEPASPDVELGVAAGLPDPACEGDGLVAEHLRDEAIALA